MPNPDLSIEGVSNNYQFSLRKLTDGWENGILNLKCYMLFHQSLGGTL